MAALLEHDGLFVGGQRMPGALFVLLRFRAEAVAELLDDVVLQVLRQLPANGDEVAIDEIHRVLHNPVE